MSALMDLINKKKQEINANNRAKTVKPPDGNSRWRILPSWRKQGDPDSEQFWHDFGSHYIKDQAEQMKAVYVCTEKTFGKPCEVCTAIAQSMAYSTDDATVKALKEANASARVLVNAVQVDGASKEVVVLELSPTAFAQVITVMQEWGDVTALDDGQPNATGRDITIERQGKGVNTKYVVQAGNKATPLPADVMAKATNLDQYVAQESDTGKLKALTSIGAVSGLAALAAPSSTGGVPSLPSTTTALADMSLDEEQEAALRGLMDGDSTAGVAEKTVEDEAPVPSAEDVAKVNATVAVAAAAASSAAASAPAADAGTDDLDALLRELEG